MEQKNRLSHDFCAGSSDSERKTVFDEGRVLLFDKPLKWTSFDLVNKIRIMIRSAFGTKKIRVGHAGTLDPLATGLMIICTGKATKRIDEFMGFDKEYVATFKIGATTPSFDLETDIDATFPVGHITKEMVEKCLQGFVGKQEQIPPMHSAKFIDGTRAYEYARKGIKRELKPVAIDIKEIELLKYNMPYVTVRIRCSKGTYIRSIARDFGEALNSGACIVELRRKAIGDYTVDSAYSIEKFDDFLKEMKQNSNYSV